ncbi:hypothetical protein [Nonomuraea sp. NPDC049607]|uniref:hypothetical protein n=1 Tax=Nonomuraea sp. NPDC049607 TaxID=3154732 RepID=UPI00344AA68B
MSRRSQMMISTSPRQRGPPREGQPGRQASRWPTADATREDLPDFAFPRETWLVGALPAEQTDERTEARRNMGLDVLAEARIQPIPTSAAQTLTA